MRSGLNTHTEHAHLHDPQTVCYCSLLDGQGPHETEQHCLADAVAHAGCVRVLADALQRLAAEDVSTWTLRPDGQRLTCFLLCAQVAKVAVRPPCCFCTLLTVDRFWVMMLQVFASR